MSTFNGQIEEIPGISVDRFTELNLSSSLYFLSHCHTDHMEGLSNEFISNLINHNKYLYCSPISKAFLLGIYKYSRGDNIIEIELAVPKTISYVIPGEGKINETFITVTTSPAGHCPGSVMFIFEKADKSILYTGDFRIDPKDLPKLNPLNNRIGDKNCAKKFAAIYLDTTFLSTDYAAFPSRRESCEEISSAIKNWLHCDKKNLVLIECSALYGPEHLFMKISKLLKEKIHVKEKVYSNYTRIKELVECVTSDGYGARIHACENKMSRDKLSCRDGVDCKNILTIVPSVQRWRGKNLRNRFVEFESGNNRRLYICCSMHASYEELAAFVDYFKPDKIYPCVYHKESQKEIDELLYQLTAYQRKSDGKEQSDFKLAVPKVGRKSKERFESEYFKDEDEDC